MGMNPQRRTRAVLGLLAVIAVMAAIDGALTWRQHLWNESIVSGPLPAETKDVPPQVRFAQANAQAESGADEAALHLYRSLEDDAEPGKAIALIELAKESYRDVLRVDPQHWDARYNLERAQRLLPDPDEMDAAPPENRRDSERAATTVRGHSPGLP
jgi:mxaK protein